MVAFFQSLQQNLLQAGTGGEGGCQLLLLQPPSRIQAEALKHQVQLQVLLSKLQLPLLHNQDQNVLDHPWGCVCWGQVGAQGMEKWGKQSGQEVKSRISRLWGTTSLFHYAQP